MSYVIAIDAGTGSIRSVIFDDTGAVVSTAARDWVHKPDPQVPGSMDFDTDTNFDLLIACVRESLADAGLTGAEVLAISASAMREGFVLLDSSGREIWACANVDARAGKQVSELMEVPGLVEKIYHGSGQTPALAAAPRLLWIKQNKPEIYDRAASILMLSEWILYRLSGVQVMEPSNGSTSGLLSLATRHEDKDLASLCGLRSDLVPPVVEPGTQIGTVSPSFANLTGLTTATRVVVGGGDAQLAALGLGQTQPGQILLTAGTFWQLNVNIGEPRTDPNLAVRVNMAAVPGLWQAEAIAFHPGTAIRWFRDTFAVQEVQAARAAGENPLDYLTRAANEIPIGSDGVIPIFSDVMNYRNWVHAAPSFLNLSLDAGPRIRSAMFRSLLENAAIVSDANLALVSGFAPVASDEPVVFAGGAASSEIWSQITADVMGRTLKIPAVTEATAQGTAACAIAATTEFDTPTQAAQAWVKWDREVRPDPDRHAQYREVKDRWRKAYAPQLDLVNAGVTTSLWRAPGA